MTDYPPDMFPPRVIIRPDGAAPVTVPDYLLDEWQDKPIPGPQEYVRRDLYDAIKRERDRLRADLDVHRNLFASKARP